MNEKKRLIKIGGSVLNSSEKSRKLLTYINRYLVPGEAILVHGGGELITRWLESFNMKTNFIAGQRVTDEKAIKVVEMVLSGLVNKGLVSLVSEQKFKAAGLSGRDADLATAVITNECLGLVGEVERVNTELLECLMAQKIIPVLSPICGDSRGMPINVNADFFAVEIAVSAGCDSLIYVTSTGGVLRDHELISEISVAGIPGLIKEGIVTAGMIPKLQSALAACEGGVTDVCFMDYEGNVGTRIA
jgi:acetylglutamate kinase